MHIFGDIMRSGNKQKGAPRLDRKHIFENGKFDVYVDCDNLKILENEKVLLAAAGNTFLKVPCSSCVFNELFWKKSKIENVLPA